VLCVDEESQVQALDQTAPMLRMQPGLAERRTHDYRRHGTTTLFAALEVATSVVTPPANPRHRHQEFLRFLKQVARAYPRARAAPGDGNYAAHKRVRSATGWPASPRVQVHFTPTSASWVNLVEVWFGIIERQAIRRGTLGSVRDLTTKIRGFIDGWNDRCHRFVWTKTADQILTTANRQKTSNTITRLMILSTCRLSARPEKVRFATRAQAGHPYRHPGAERLGLGRLGDWRTAGRGGC
jgi:hypothetical protein